MYIKLKMDAPELDIDLDFEMEINEDEICVVLETLSKIGMDMISSETNTKSDDLITTEAINCIIENIKDVLDELDDLEPDVNSYDLDSTEDVWDVDMDNVEDEGECEGPENSNTPEPNVWRV